MPVSGAPSFAARAGTTPTTPSMKIGVPLILNVYGEPGATPLFLLLAIHLPIMMSAAAVLVESSEADWPLTRKFGSSSREALRLMRELQGAGGKAAFDRKVHGRG